MNAYTYSLLALEIARERSREADERWLASHLRQEGSGPVRRTAARSMITISRAAASVARRLDHRVAEDQLRRLALAK